MFVNELLTMGVLPKEIHKMMSCNLDLGLFMEDSPTPPSCPSGDQESTAFPSLGALIAAGPQFFNISCSCPTSISSSDISSLNLMFRLFFPHDHLLPALTYLTTCNTSCGLYQEVQPLLAPSWLLSEVNSMQK